MRRTFRIFISRRILQAGPKHSLCNSLTTASFDLADADTYSLSFFPVFVFCPAYAKFAFLFLPIVLWFHVTCVSRGLIESVARNNTFTDSAAAFVPHCVLQFLRGKYIANVTLTFRNSRIVPEIRCPPFTSILSVYFTSTSLLLRNEM